MCELGVVSRGVCVLAVAGLLAGHVSAQDLPAPAARIQRQAENPLRWILEAGKLKARAKAPAIAAARPAPPKSPLRTAAVMPARTAATPVAPVAPVVPAAAVAPSPARPEVAPAEPPSAASAPNADTPAVATAPESLELVDGDEPVLPEAIDAELQDAAVLELAVVVMADGAVGAVSVVSSSHPVVNEHAVAAVRGWRFKPIAQSQMRIVELVFHPRR